MCLRSCLPTPDSTRKKELWLQGTSQKIEGRRRPWLAFDTNPGDRYFRCRWEASFRAYLPSSLKS